MALPNLSFFFRKIDLVRDVFVITSLFLLFVHFLPDQKKLNILFIYMIISLSASVFGSFKVTEWLSTKPVSFLVAFITFCSMLAFGLLSAMLSGFWVVPLSIGSFVGVVLQKTTYDFLFAWVIGFTEEVALSLATYLSIRNLTGNKIVATIFSAIVFAWIHSKAYIGVDPMDFYGIVMSGRKALLLLAPFAVRLIMCPLFEMEKGIIGGSLGHAIYDFFVLSFMK